VIPAFRPSPAAALWVARDDRLRALALDYPHETL